MKLSCCSWSYHRAMQAGRIDFADWLRICAKDLQVGGVDIIAEQMPRRGRRFWLETKKRCTDGRLTIVSLSPGNDFGKATARARQREVDAVTRWIEAAFVMGAPCVRIFAGWAPPSEQEARWGAMVACIRQVARAAAQAGVTLAVEPHDAGGFLPDSRRTLRLIRDVGSPWVRINLDTGNYTDSDPYAGIAASLPYAPHVVAKIHRLDASGEEVTLDYDRIFRLLSRHRYHGFVTVEYEGRADELASVPKAVAMLRRYGRKHGL